MNGAIPRQIGPMTMRRGNCVSITAARSVTPCGSTAEWEPYAPETGRPGGSGSVPISRGADCQPVSLFPSDLCSPRVPRKVQRLCRPRRRSEGISSVCRSGSRSGDLRGRGPSASGASTMPGMHRHPAPRTVDSCRTPGGRRSAGTAWHATGSREGPRWRSGVVPVGDVGGDPLDAGRNTGSAFDWTGSTIYPWPGARSRHRRDRARLAALYGWCGGVLPSACSAGAETAQLQPGIDAGRLRQGEALRQGADMPASSAAVRCGRSAPAGSVPLGDGPCRAGGEGAARVLDGAVHPSSDAGRVRRQGEVTHRMFEASKPGVEMMSHVGWGQRT